MTYAQTFIFFQLFGSDGMASGESPRRSTSVTDAAHGALLRQLHHSFPQRFEGAFESLLTHFVDCMDGVYYFICKSVLNMLFL